MERNKMCIKNFNRAFWWVKTTYETEWRREKYYYQRTGLRGKDDFLLNANVSGRGRVWAPVNMPMHTIVPQTARSVLRMWTTANLTDKNLLPCSAPPPPPPHPLRYASKTPISGDETLSVQNFSPLWKTQSINKSKAKLFNSNAFWLETELQYVKWHTKAYFKCRSGHDMLTCREAGTGNIKE